MKKTDIAKAVVNNLNGFAIGSATSGILKASVPKTNNAVINVFIDASILVAGFSVSGAAMKPVRAYTDETIDNFVDAIASAKNN